METEFIKNGMFYGRLCPFILPDELDKELKFNCDLLYISFNSYYDKLFKFLDKNKDKEIIVECDKFTNIEKFLNDCPRREDCLPIIDYIYYQVDSDFVVSDIENLRMDDTVFCKIDSEAEYEFTKQLINRYTNCNFELCINPTIRNKILNNLISEKPIITSRTRVIF